MWNSCKSVFQTFTQGNSNNEIRERTEEEGKNRKREYMERKKYSGHEIKEVPTA